MECEVKEIESTLEDEVMIGYQYAEKAIQNQELPQVILARDDAMAIGIYSACMQYQVCLLYTSLLWSIRWMNPGAIR